MRILMICQWFDPEPTLKGLSFAKELARLGNVVQVLTGFPNYPGGRIYKGYKISILDREVMDGIEIIRVPLYPSHDGSSFKRSLNYLSFALSATLLGSMLVRPIDLIYFYHPPATVGLPAWFLGMLYRVPIVCDIVDLWPESLFATGMVNNRVLIKVVEHWCAFIYHLAARIVVLSPGSKKALCNRGVRPDKIQVIYNWTMEEHIHPSGRNKQLAKMIGMAEKFNIVFAGNIGLAQDLETIIKVAERLSHNELVQFVIIGSGIDLERIKALADASHIKNVIFVPRLPLQQIGEILSLADVLLVNLKKDPLFEITIPSKTQAYMAIGRPILMCVQGDAADLIEKSKSGIVCVPEDVDSIVHGIKKFLSMSRSELETMGRNGQKYYHDKLSFIRGVKLFDKLFKSVVYS